MPQIQDRSSDFHELEVLVQGASNDSPIAVTLYEGVRFTYSPMDVTPYADGRSKKSDNPGTTITGYVHSKRDGQIKMTADKLGYGEITGVGGWAIHERAIHSIRELKAE